MRLAKVFQVVLVVALVMNTIMLLFTQSSTTTTTTTTTHDGFVAPPPPINHHDEKDTRIRDLTFQVKSLQQELLLQQVKQQQAPVIKDDNNKHERRSYNNNNNNNNNLNNDIIMPSLKELVETQLERPEDCPKDTRLFENIWNLNSTNLVGIPPILHLTSKSSCLSMEFYNNILKWKDKLLPDHVSIVLHNDAAMDRLLFDMPLDDFPHISLLYKQCVFSGASKADLWRSLVLWEYGGIYTDLDNAPGPHLMDQTVGLHLEKDQAYFVLDQFTHSLSQYFMASQRRHPLLYLNIQHILFRIQSVDNLAKQYVPYTTGPGALKMATADFIKAAGAAAVRPPPLANKNNQTTTNTSNMTTTNATTTTATAGTFQNDNNSTQEEEMEENDNDDPLTSRGQVDVPGVYVGLGNWTFRVMGGRKKHFGVGSQSIVYREHIKGKAKHAAYATMGMRHFQKTKPRHLQDISCLAYLAQQNNRKNNNHNHNHNNKNLS